MVPDAQAGVRADAQEEIAVVDQQELFPRCRRLRFLHQCRNNRLHCLYRRHSNRPMQTFGEQARRHRRVTPPMSGPILIAARDRPRRHHQFRRDLVVVVVEAFVVPDRVHHDCG